MILKPLFSWRSAICESDLTPTQRHVALTLSLHMSERGDSCFPSSQTLARETGLGYSTVREALTQLCAAGWLAKEERRRGDGGQTSNTYTAATPCQEPAGGSAPAGTPLPGAGTHPCQELAPIEDVQKEDVSEDVSDLLPAVVEATPPAKVSATARRQIYDALAQGCGWDLNEMTKDAKRVTSLAVNDLVAMGVDSPIEVARRCIAYRVKFSGAACTPKAVVKHWPGLRPELVEAEQTHRDRMAQPRKESAADKIARLRSERGQS